MIGPERLEGHARNTAVRNQYLHPAQKRTSLVNWPALDACIGRMKNEKLDRPARSKEETL